MILKDWNHAHEIKEQIILDSNKNQLKFVKDLNATKEDWNASLILQSISIITNDEIQRGDCFIENMKYLASGNHIPIKDRLNKKIIASNDESLKSICISCNGQGSHDKDGFNQCKSCDTSGYKSLPKPSKEFLEHYFEHNHKGICRI
jgi:hypothetical protein